MLKHLSVKAENCFYVGKILYVGDSLVDAKTAENAKVKFAAVLTGTTTKDEFADYKSVCIADNISIIVKNLFFY